MSVYPPPNYTEYLPIFNTTNWENNTTTTSSGTSLTPLSPSPAGTYQSVQNVVVDSYGRTTAVEQAESGMYLANGQHQAYDPLPQYPVFSGSWNNVVQTSIGTDSWLYSTYSGHNTLSIKITNMSQYNRYDFFMVRISVCMCENNNNGSSPFPFGASYSGSWNIIIFPQNLVDLTATSGGSIPAPTSNYVYGYFDIDTNNILTNLNTYSSNFQLVNYPTPQPTYAPNGRAIWTTNPSNQGGTANWLFSLYPTQVSATDTSILTFTTRNPIVLSNIPQQYSQIVSAELIGGGRHLNTISFIS